MPGNGKEDSKQTALVVGFFSFSHIGNIVIPSLYCVLVFALGASSPPPSDMSCLVLA